MLRQHCDFHSTQTWKSRAAFFSLAVYSSNVSEGGNGGVVRVLWIHNSIKVVAHIAFGNGNGNVDMARSVTRRVGCVYAAKLGKCKYVCFSILSHIQTVQIQTHAHSHGKRPCTFLLFAIYTRAHRHQRLPSLCVRMQCRAPSHSQALLMHETAPFSWQYSTNFRQIERWCALWMECTNSSWAARRFLHARPSLRRTVWPNTGGNFIHFAVCVDCCKCEFDENGGARCK